MFNERLHKWVYRADYMNSQEQYTGEFITGDLDEIKAVLDKQGYVFVPDNGDYYDHYKHNDGTFAIIDDDPCCYTTKPEYVDPNEVDYADKHDIWDYQARLGE